VHPIDPISPSNSKPKRHHGFHFFIMVMGWLLPPLAVALRFGIGKDFFINVVCTICGYIPGHFHNFFIQNIRNNKNNNHTPKWATRYGLVEDYNKKKQKKRAWVNRYNQDGERQMYDDDGNVYTYGRDHQFEDGDGPARPRERRDNRVEGLEDNYYRTERPGRDDASLHRSRSNRSFNSNAYGGAEPGAGEAELRRNKKTGVLGMLGGKKGKADRHARSEQVMGGANDSDYIRQNPYDGSRDDSFEGSSNHRNSFGDGPEDADATVGKRYARNGTRSHRDRDPLDSKTLPLAPIPRAPEPVVDIMNDNHQF
jgi:uncharacterized membrane protein YqaE (UPF0057 family)